MADVKFQFEVDAGKILAKMHLGGCEKYNKAGYKFFNTGILDNVNMTPEQVTSSTKITFDFSNNTGIYELGVLLPDFNAPIKTSPEDIKKTDDKVKADKEADAKSKAETNSKITDTAEQVDDKKDSELGNKDNSDDEYSEEARKMIAQNRDLFNKYVAAKKKIAVKVLKEYMTTFGGKENAAKVDDKTVIMTYLPLTSLDPYKVKYNDWKIPAMTDEEISEMFDKQLEDPKIRGFKLDNICFKTLYKIELKTEK